MSGIGGGWFFAGQGAEPVLARLSDALAYRGPDCRGRLWRPPVGMVYRGFHTTAESRRVTEPVTGAGGAMAVWDGRLDNRDELGRALDVPAGASDEAFVLAAAERWPEGFLERLIGDWALALWQPRHQTLSLACDPMGARPLFYYQGPQYFLWASTMEALLAAAGLSRELDEQWLGGLFGAWTEPESTPYPDIRRVPPGTVVEVTAERRRQRRFWRPRFRPQLRCPSDGDYEARFAALLRQAVRRRLRTDGAAGAHLSGGLDSSSIVVIGDDLLHRGETEATALLPVSFVHDASVTSDERRFIHAVEERLGRRGHHVHQEDHPLFADPDQPFCEIPGALQCAKAREHEVNRWLRENGARVLLAGTGGDQLLWSEVDVPLELADLLGAGRLRAFARSLRAWGGVGGRPYLELIVQGALYPLAPRPLRARWGKEKVKVPACLEPDFVRRTGLRQRLFWENGLDGHDASPSERHRLANLEHAIHAVSWIYDRGPLRLEVCYPFLDRTLVEFCLTLPGEQLVRIGETRSLQRRALRSLLPAEVLSRRTKASLNEAILRALRAAWPAIAAVLPSLRVADLGLVDPRAFADLAQRSRLGLTIDTPLLLQILDLEFWLRAQEKLLASAVL